MLFINKKFFVYLVSFDFYWPSKCGSYFCRTCIKCPMVRSSKLFFLQYIIPIGVTKYGTCFNQHNIYSSKQRYMFRLQNDGYRQV